MIKPVVTACTIVALLSTSAAHAVSVTNRDEKDYKVSIIEGGVKQDHVLKPSQVLNGVCGKGCIIRLDENENDEYELEGSEVVSIEDGYLYYDGSDAPEEPDPGTSGEPSQDPSK